MIKRTLNPFTGLLLGVIAALIAALMVVAEPGDDPRDSDPIPEPGTLVETKRPVLTPEQETQVVDVALADPRVQSLTERLDVSGWQVLVWGKGNAELLGGVVNLQFSSPQNIDGEWLAFNYDERKPDPVESIAYRASYANVTSLNVFVNLRDRVVAGVTPDPDAESDRRGPPSDPNTTPSSGAGS